MTTTSRSEDARERLVAAMAEAAGVSGYEELLGQVADVVLQATSPAGKGEVRHAHGRPWADQPITGIPRLLGGDAGRGFLLGQAIKKLQESLGLSGAARVGELHGAAVYVLTAAALEPTHR